jgi:hypothetical protein
MAAEAATAMSKSTNPADNGPDALRFEASHWTVLEYMNLSPAPLELPEQVHETVVTLLESGLAGLETVRSPSPVVRPNRGAK